MNYADRLKQIMRSSGWSQEQLAAQLGVTFATLNSWVNERSVPRTKALHSIESLHVQMLGAEEVSQEKLAEAIRSAQGLKVRASDISGDADVLDKLTLYLTYHTNTIEGSTMTLSDVGEVIFDNKVLSNRTAVEQAEARNHQAALHWLIDQLSNRGSAFNITEQLVCDIHLRLMNGIMSDAGVYRKHSVRIMGSHTSVANWLKIPELMAALMVDMNDDAEDIVKRLAATHAAFEQIHPFSDGNGRTGRLLLFAQALRFGVMPPLVVKERKAAYYKYLELAQAKETMEPLGLFMAECMQFTNALLGLK